MLCFVRQIGRVLVVAVCLCAVGPATAPRTAGTVPVDPSQAQLPPEVRLRKLHLVRPDLIPYPLVIETYC